MFRKRDFLWLLAFPIYQTIGTLRHEGSHALAAIWEGATITKFVFLPSIPQGGGVLWGYVSWQGQTSWWTRAAPYLCDALTFFFFFILCWKIMSLPRWLWLNMAAVGLLSPLVNSFYNYLGGFRRSGNDVARLLGELPAGVVHSYFLVTMILYGVGLFFVFRRMNQYQKE